MKARMTVAHGPLRLLEMEDLMNARFAISMCAFVLAGNAMADDAANGVVMIERQNVV